MMKALELFKEKNGKISFSRVSGSLLVISYLIGYFYILFTKHELVDIPIQLAGLILLLYGTNRYSSRDMNSSEQSSSLKDQNLS